MHLMNLSHNEYKTNMLLFKVFKVIERSITYESFNLVRSVTTDHKSFFYLILTMCVLCDGNL